MWKIKEDVEDKEKVKLDIKNGLATLQDSVFIIAEEDGMLLICKLSEEQRIKQFSEDK